MNLPNKITFCRIALIPVFLLCFFFLPYGEAWSAVIFVAAAISDALDGKIARKRGLITTLGKFIDPLADKLLVLSALAALVAEDMLPVMVLLIILWRDMAVDGLRIVAAAKGEVIAASQWGKWKTTSQLLAITALLLSRLSWWPQPLYMAICQILMILAVLLTIVSGYDYFRKGWRHLQS